MSELFYGLFDNPALGLSFSGDGDNPIEPTETPEDPDNPDNPTDTGTTGDVNMTIQRIELGKIYHVPHGTPYHRENSRQGCRYAAKHGYDSIDLDMQIDADDMEQNTHWERPLHQDGFVDPAHKIVRDARVIDLHSAQVARLVAEGEYKIEPMPIMIPYAHSLGLKIRAEAKGDQRWTVERFRKMRAYTGNAKVVIATLDNYNPDGPFDWRDILRNARAAGFDTRRLYA